MDEKWDKKRPRDASSLPPRARNIADLQLTIHSKKEILSSNEVYLMKKKKHGINKLTPLYFFKNHDSSSRLSELEAYCAAICELLATPDYVSTSRPYYDEKNQLVGVASKEIVGFKSNFDAPLQKHETRINSVVLNREENQRIIKDVAQKLLYHYEIYYVPSFTEPTVYDVQCCLLELLNISIPFPETILPKLASAFNARKKEVTWCNDISELQLLNQGQKAIDTLLSLENNLDEELISIALLEALDKEIKNTPRKSFDGFFDEDFDSCFFKIPLQDVTNYSLLKGLGVSLTTRYLFKEKDNSNSNMSKKGHFIDFEWTKANISCDFHAPNRLNDLFRNSKENSFPCNQSTIESFPDIENSNVFYWPTRQPEVHKKLFNYVSEFLTQCEHKLEEEDETLYKQLAKLIVFINTVKEHAFSTPKSFLDLTCDYAYQTVIYFKAFVTRRPVEALLAEQTIKFTFAQLNQEFIQWSNEVNKEIAGIDKEEVSAWLQKVLGTIDIKINVLTTVYQEIKSAITSYSKDHITAVEAEDINNFYGVIDTLFEELKARFDFCSSEFKKEWDCINRNTFSREDNEVYKSLAYNPVFIFHKYKTFLKYILTNEEMYRAYVSLNISKKPCNEVEGKSYSLGERLVNDELQRISEVRKTLVGMPDFKHFLVEHGQFAFELIKEEFQITKDKYAKKENAVHYQKLVQALDIEVIEGEFNNLCYDCGIDNDEDEYDMRLC